MVKFYSNSHVFRFDWQSVTNVWWQKYPNMHNLTVEQVDTLDRKIDADTGALTMRRLISCSMNLPSWLNGIGFPSRGFVLEQTTINPFSRSMVINTMNLSMDSLLSIQETCKYSPDPENPSEWTHYETTAEFTSPLPLVNSGVEGFSFSLHSENALKGLNAMEQLCNRWAKEGLDGFQTILNGRLESILLMEQVSALKLQIQGL